MFLPTLLLTAASTVLLSKSATGAPPLSLLSLSTPSPKNQIKDVCDTVLLSGKINSSAGNHEVQINEKGGEAEEEQQRNQHAEILSCRIRGFYPFVGTKPTGLLGFLVNDIHTAIEITSNQPGSAKLLFDFMTENGQAADVWCNEALQLCVLLGYSIPGEVRLLNKPWKNTGTMQVLTPQLEKVVQYAESYNTNMNLYTNNCRTFTRNMRNYIHSMNEDILKDIE